MPTTTLFLQASDVRDSAHWYWRLQDANGAFLADHTVALDPTEPVRMALTVAGWVR